MTFIRNFLSDEMPLDELLQRPKGYLEHWLHSVQVERQYISNNPDVQSLRRQRKMMRVFASLQRNAPVQRRQLEPHEPRRRRQSTLLHYLSRDQRDG